MPLAPAEDRYREGKPVVNGAEFHRCPTIKVNASGTTNDWLRET